jgi:TIR domain
MPPEHPPYLVILHSSFSNGNVLVGRAEYIEALGTLSVRWGIGTPPTGYIEEGGGVVFVANQSPRRPPPDENARIELRQGHYFYQEGLTGAPWMMLVMILPPGHVLGDASPAPAASRLFGDRLAVYWRLSPAPGVPKYVELSWSLLRVPDVGKALSESEARTPFPFEPTETPEFGVFVSYRRDDSQWAAGRIKDWVSRALGERSVFRDSDSIRAGEDFRKKIDTAVGRCKVMLALIGSTWLHQSDASGRRRLDSEGDWVRIEIESALQRHRVVIPVLLDGAKMPEAASLPESLRELAFLHAYAVRESTFERDVSGLIDQLRAHVTETAK